MDELDSFLLFQGIQLLPDFLQGTESELLPVKDEPQAIEQLQFFHQYSDFLAQLLLVLCHGFFPDKSIAVGGRFDLGAVDEEVFP